MNICETCKKTYPSTSKFCADCGGNLTNGNIFRTVGVAGLISGLLLLGLLLIGEFSIYEMPSGASYNLSMIIGLLFPFVLILSGLAAVFRTKEHGYRITGSFVIGSLLSVMALNALVGKFIGGTLGSVARSSWGLIYILVAITIFLSVGIIWLIDKILTVKRQSTRVIITTVAGLIIGATAYVFIPNMGYVLLGISGEYGQLFVSGGRIFSIFIPLFALDLALNYIIAARNIRRYIMSAVVHLIIAALFSYLFIIMLRLGLNGAVFALAATELIRTVFSGVYVHRITAKSKGEQK
ncbi:hypothetical protein FACS189425_02160 [Clostridia bacterium]|nr:hypothetical protein FACS189425_02160 [Clostridia bacterium]